MEITQAIWTEHGPPPRDGEGEQPLLVLAFAPPQRLQWPETWQSLRRRWPNAAIVAASTAGEIQGARVLDESLVTTTLTSTKTAVRCASTSLASHAGSEDAGAALASMLAGPGLRHVLVFSDGLNVNGSALVRGLTRGLPPAVSLSGGLCGDGARFERTFVSLNAFDEAPSVVGIGFYGDELRVGVGSLGGWDSFGPERRITRSEGNVLYELDGQPALSLYEKYLGHHAADLPASGLLFPLTVRAERQGQGVVRTILGVNSATKSLRFAGDVPVGSFARLMHANFDRLIDGAVGAAVASRAGLRGSRAELAILISCIGRKLVLKQRVEEELEGVQRVVGPEAKLTGFYSYGEISPFAADARCELHNQTMTVTTLSEA
jgi:hypothetical protein